MNQPLHTQADFQLYQFPSLTPILSRPTRQLFWESTLKDAFATQMAGHFQPLREFASHHLYKLMLKAGDPMYATDGRAGR